MVRSRKQPPERTLKRLLLSGNTTAAEKLLQQLLQENPQPSEILLIESEDSNRSFSAAKILV